MKRIILTTFTLTAFMLTGLSQLRSFTYQGEYKFKTQKDFDTTYIIAFPEKWIEAKEKWTLKPSQVTINFHGNVFGFTTPKGQIFCTVIDGYERNKAGHKFKVKIRSNDSPYNGTIGDIVFVTDNNNNWVALAYTFPDYMTGMFILAEKKINQHD